MSDIKITAAGKTASFNAEHAATKTKDEFIAAHAHTLDAATLASVHDKCMLHCGLELSNKMAQPAKSKKSAKEELDGE